MLQRKPQHRLGFNGVHEIKEHPWLKDFDFKALYEKRLEAPFIPKVGDNFDKKYCESADKLGMETLERYQKYYGHEEFQNIFNNYTFLSNIPEEFAKENSVANKKLTASIIKSKIKINESGNVGNNAGTNPSQMATPVRHVKSLSSNTTSYANFMKDKNMIYKLTPNNINVKTKTINLGTKPESQKLVPRIKEIRAEKLPSIEVRNPMAKPKMNYSPSVNMFNKFTKNVTISSNSTGSSNTSVNGLHKRSGSTNNFNYQ